MRSRFQSLTGLEDALMEECENKEIVQELKSNGKGILAESQGKSLTEKVQLILC